MNDADELRRDRILAARRSKQQLAEQRAASLGVSASLGAMQTKCMLLDVRVKTLEAQVAKLLKRVGLTDG